MTRCPVCQHPVVHQCCDGDDGLLLLSQRRDLSFAAGIGKTCVNSSTGGDCISGMQEIVPSIGFHLSEKKAACYVLYDKLQPDLLWG